MNKESQKNPKGGYAPFLLFEILYDIGACYNTILAEKQSLKSDESNEKFLVFKK
jgi:hypothetical protein